MKIGDPTSTCQARLNPVTAVVTVRDGVKNSLGSQTLEARSSSSGWGLYSKSKWCDLKEKRDMVWFMVLKNYFGSCVVIFWQCHQVSWTKASVGSPMLSFWSRIPGSTISPSEVLWICWFLSEPQSLKLFFFNVDFQSVILKISLFSYIAKHGLGATMLEDTFPSTQTCASSDFLSQWELSDQQWMEVKQLTLFLYQAPSLPQWTTMTTCISIFLFVFIK